MPKGCWRRLVSTLRTPRPTTSPTARCAQGQVLLLDLPRPSFPSFLSFQSHFQCYFLWDPCWDPNAASSSYRILEHPALLALMLCLELCSSSLVGHSCGHAQLPPQDFQQEGHAGSIRSGPQLLGLTSPFLSTLPPHASHV